MAPAATSCCGGFDDNRLMHPREMVISLSLLSKSEDSSHFQSSAPRSTFSKHQSNHPNCPARMRISCSHLSVRSSAQPRGRLGEILEEISTHCSRIHTANSSFVLNRAWIKRRLALAAVADYIDYDYVQRRVLVNGFVSLELANEGDSHVVGGGVDVVVVGGGGGPVAAVQLFGRQHSLDRVPR